jgi:hypothetical protein
MVRQQDCTCTGLCRARTAACTRLPLARQVIDQGSGVALAGQRVWASHLRMRGLRRARAVDGLPDHGADAVRRAAGLARQVQVVLVVHVQV